jgi:hypothetical protein
MDLAAIYQSIIVWLRRAAGNYLLLFALLTGVYHSNLRPIASGDSLPASLVPFSLLLDHSITLDRFGPDIETQVWYGSTVLHKAGDHWYSVYPIAGPVLATPLYLPIVFVPGIRKMPPATLISIARILEKAVAVFLAAATVIALLFLLRRVVSERAAWLLTLVFAFGTGNWSTSSQALWQHTFGQLTIVGCLYAVARWDGEESEPRWEWMAGLSAALALAIRPTNAALLPGLALALWLGRARAMRYLRLFAGPAFGAALVQVYNVGVFGNAGGGYRVRLNGHVLEGLVGVLFSPGRGLLIYTPIVVLTLAALAPQAREMRRRHRSLLVAAGVFVLLHISIVAAWPIWWGGYCWGPRLLTEILVPLMAILAIGWPALQTRGFAWVFGVMALYCLLVQALGVYCYPKGHWDHLPISVDDAPARLWDWADNPFVRTARGGIAWEPYAIVWATVTGGLPAGAEALRQLGVNPF